MRLDVGDAAIDGQLAAVFQRFPFQFPAILPEIEDVHFFMAVGAQDHGIGNRVCAALIQRPDVMKFKVGLVPFIAKGGRAVAKLADSIGPASGEFSDAGVVVTVQWAGMTICRIAAGMRHHGKQILIG